MTQTSRQRRSRGSPTTSSRPSAGASPRTSPRCRSSPAASSPAGTTTPEARLGFSAVRRLLPDPGPTTVDDQLDGYRPWERPEEDRPMVAMNFAATVDGRATIDGVSGPIGSDTDTTMLSRLRTRFDAVMIGAGTMRAERYGRLAKKQETRERRERLGLPPEPLMGIARGRVAP